MTGGLATVGMPVLTTWILFRLLRRGSPHLAAGLRLALAGGATLAVVSVNAFAFLALRGGLTAGLAVGELTALAAALLALGLRRGPTANGHRPEHSARPRDDAAPRFFRIGLCAVGASAALQFIERTLRHPHGGQDAWAIWNLRARFLYRGGENWTAAFSPALEHTDYPLLLPGLVARSWTILGHDSAVVPAAVAGVFAALTVLGLFGALATLRGRLPAELGAATLLATPFFVPHAATQFADVPLAYFYLAATALVTIAAAWNRPDPWPLVGAGFFASCAAWTKNEGLLFWGALLVSHGAATAWTCGRRRALADALYFVAGSLPVLAVLVGFKLALAPPNDIVATLDAARIFAQFTTPERYARLWRGVVRLCRDFDRCVLDLLPMLCALSWCVGGRPAPHGRRSTAPLWGTLGLVLGAYLAVYLQTYWDIETHVLASLDRLLLQLWPTLLFGVFLRMRAPRLTAA